MKDRKKYIKLIIFIAIIIVIVVLNRVFGWSSYIGNPKYYHFLKRMVEENKLYAILIYMAATIIGSVLLALPGVTFAVLAGVLFGPVQGTICCSIAATGGAVLSFVAGRFFLRDSIRPTAMKNKYLKKWLFDESGKNQIFVLMITRLIPVFPFNLQNFAYGVTDISFVTYTVGSFVFMLPGTAIYTIGAAGVADGENRATYLAIAAVMAVAVSGAGIILKRQFLTDDNKNEEDQNGEEDHI